jgi:uncharacterized protein YjbJ (UPF0337 family)
MSGQDKAKNKAQKLAGQAKEKTGQATGNENLEADGLADQATGDIKDAGEKIKDAFKG